MEITINNNYIWFKTNKTEFSFNNENVQFLGASQCVDYRYAFEVNLDTFCILLKKWAFERGFMISEDGHRVRIWEREYSEGLFVAETPDKMYLSTEVFSVDNILTAGTYILGESSPSREIEE